MAHKTSAVEDQEPIDVLFALHPKFNLMDFAGPMEVLTQAQHDFKNPNTKAFEVTIAASEPKVLSGAGVIIGSQISWKEAHERLADFDVLIVLGGNIAEVLEKKLEPLDLITAFAKVQAEDPTRERTLMSICTGSLLLAKQGILAGLSATTHPDSFTKFENLCSEAATRELDERTDVIEDARYVVNNLRFDLGDEDENPYIRRKSDAGKHAPGGRKGSISFTNSNKRRESMARRAAMRLGGLRVITAGGVASGIDATLYLVSATVSEETANEVARIMQTTWNKGTVVDGLDV